MNLDLPIILTEPNYDILLAVKLSPVKRYSNRKKFTNSSGTAAKISDNVVPMDFGQINCFDKEPSGDDPVVAVLQTFYRRKCH